ncbi:MAG: hypothetical protein ACI9JL_002321 [Paracoccaceae bacterium]|jgi:hypothetical protein
MIKIKQDWITLPEVLQELVERGLDADDVKPAMQRVFRDGAENLKFLRV